MQWFKWYIVNIIRFSLTTGEEPTENDEPKFMYYVNDGVYGSFNCLLFDHAEVQPMPLYPPKEDEPLFECSIWGPTCDGLDCISQLTLMPEMEAGSWMVVPDMGAYTVAASSTFNGMPRPGIVYVSKEIYRLVQDHQSFDLFIVKMLINSAFIFVSNWPSVHSLS